MKQMNPRAYNAAHERMRRCLTSQYKNIAVEEVGKVYSESRIERERNTPWRNESTVIVTVAIAKSRLESMILS